MTDDEFGDFYDKVWSQLETISHRRYSKYSRDYGDHLDDTLEAIRAFPMCPLILTSRMEPKMSFANKTRNDLITREIAKFDSTIIPEDWHWRSMGYVDVYSTMHLTDCVKKHLKDKFEWVYVGKKKFKTFGSPLEITLCQYGENALTEFPNKTKTFWNSFIEDLLISNMTTGKNFTDFTIQ